MTSIIMETNGGCVIISLLEQTKVQRSVNTATQWAKSLRTYNPQKIDNTRNANKVK